MSVDTYCVNAFTSNGIGGNPAGVVLNTANLTEGDMQYIAKQLGYAETAFVLPDEQCDFHLRFFTPTEEVDFCGHATVASFSLLFQKNNIKPGQFVQRTRAGIFAVTVNTDGFILMQQRLPETKGIVAPEEIANSLNIPLTWLNIELSPIEKITTGLLDILVPIKSGYLDKIYPDMEKVAEVSRRHQAIGFHLFELSSQKGITAFCRNFAPLVGIPEESATGSASGALASYLTKHRLVTQKDFLFKQGCLMPNPGVINAIIYTDNRSITDVQVGGYAATPSLIRLSI